MEMVLEKAGFQSDQLLHLCPHDLVWTGRTVPVFRQIMGAIAQITYHRWLCKGRPDLHVRNYGGVAGKPLRQVMRDVARGLYRELDFQRKRVRARVKARMKKQRRQLLWTLKNRRIQKAARIARYKRYCRRRLNRRREVDEEVIETSPPPPVTRSRSVTSSTEPQPGGSKEPDDIIVISDTEIKSERDEEEYILSL